MGASPLKKLITFYLQLKSHDKLIDILEEV